jgi:hypothetical protein
MKLRPRDLLERINWRRLSDKATGKFPITSLSAFVAFFQCCLFMECFAIDRSAKLRDCLFFFQNTCLKVSAL